MDWERQRAYDFEAGKEAKAEEDAIAFLEQGTPPETIAECIKLPLEKVLELQKRIEERKSKDSQIVLSKELRIAVSSTAMTFSFYYAMTFCSYQPHPLPQTGGIVSGNRGAAGNRWYLAEQTGGNERSIRARNWW